MKIYYSAIIKNDKNMPDEYQESKTIIYLLKKLLKNNCDKIIQKNNQYFRESDKKRIFINKIIIKNK